jgi:NAD-dependent DNA ligase
MENISKFKKYGIKILETFSQNDLTQLIETADNAFHTRGEPILTDTEYDILRNYIETKNPNIRNSIGASVEKNKIVLPYTMPSMNKIKPNTNALSCWANIYKGSYVISSKLDGVSGLYSTENGKLKLYTRGDGNIGQDISNLIPYLNLPTIPNITIRGEFIISKKVFEEKYKKDYSNSRNMVAGIINSKTINERIYDIIFMAYEMITPIMTPTEQMVQLQNYGFSVVRHIILLQISNETLSNILQEWRTEEIFDIDGIIVADDKVYPRTNKNPEHAFAFKMVLTDQMTEAIVIDVIWEASKDGYLKPRVQIEPIILGGVSIQYATGFNASFIVNNKIGIGAVIQLVRSGDVIPYIKSVLIPATTPKLPEEDYIWNETNIDIIIQNKEENEMVREKIITGFFTTISVEGVGKGIVRKLIDAGFDTIAKIIKMKKHDFLAIDGFQEKLSNKIVESIQQQIQKSSFEEIMVASNKMGRGFGIKKVETIFQEYPNVLGEQNMEKLSNVKGMSKKTAEEFIQNIPGFLQFLKDCDIPEKSVQIREPAPILSPENSSPLNGKIIIMTGFRDAKLELWLKQNGSNIGTNVNKKTSYVLRIQDDFISEKIKEAERLNIPVLTKNEFCEKYNYDC